MFWFWPFKNPHTELHEVHQESINKIFEIIKLHGKRLKYLEGKYLESLKEFKEVYKTIRDLNECIENLLKRIKALEDKKGDTQ